MAQINKHWQNGDELTLTTGVGSITVTSDENLTRRERHMNINVQTTAGSPQVSATVLIRQTTNRKFIGAGGKYFYINNYIEL